MDTRGSVIRIITGIVLALAALAPLGAQRAVEVLSPNAAIAAHVISRFPAPAVFARASDGRYLVLDRRAHAVFLIEADRQSARQIIGIGNQPGQLLRPVTMALGPNDLMAVLDLPGEYQRLQFFTTDGRLAGGFFLPIASGESLLLDSQSIGGIGAIAFDGESVWMNVPSWGTLVTGIDMAGRIVGSVGELRRTGQEGRAGLHHALNTGFPLVASDGSIVFVFQTGVPLLRRYDSGGSLAWERHIEGVELDPILQRLPDVWPDPTDGSRPLPAPVVRAAAIDRDGFTWIALQTGHIYVYDSAGEKRRVITLGGPARALPSSLFLTEAGALLVGPGGYEVDTAPP